MNLTGNWASILVRFLGWHVTVTLKDGNVLSGTLKPRPSYAEAITLGVINDLGGLAYTVEDLPIADIDTIEIL